ncbi:hypothetical protein [Cellulomonas sp. 73-145]|uniref:hypothetical protein n=1 Tax=Cellulomonas sp. 73-145 TaxID=1895739 RepID=UPI0025C1633C|nr:hypothetical protein [Cellulomonas sp. 73-145]
MGRSASAVLSRLLPSLLLGGLLLAGCTGGGSAASPTRPAGSATATSSPSDGSTGVPSSAASALPSDAGCRVDYTPAPLPTWARGGFTPPDVPVPYVLSDAGDIVAILWATHDPLVAPPVAGQNNKILWVPRVASPVGTPLQIRATLTATGMTAFRAVDGGLGPSTIDLPAPGCWSLDLTWGAHHDHLELAYATS